MTILAFFLMSIFVFAVQDLPFVNGDKTYVISEIDKLRDNALNKKLQVRMFQEILESEGINQSYPKIKIGFENKLGDRYKIYSVEYIINGTRAFYYQEPEESLRTISSVNTSIEEFEISLAPGEHNIQAVISYVGNDKGIFSYLSEYKVQMSEQKSLKLNKDNDYNLKVQTYQKGGLLADFKEKARLRIALQEVAK